MPADHDAFDLLEALADRMEANGDRERAGRLRACFARGTGGIGPIDYMVDILAVPAMGEGARETVARIVDPPAFSDRYAPVLPSRHEKWLTNKNRRIRAAAAKADAILAALTATPDAGGEG